MKKYVKILKRRVYRSSTIYNIYNIDWRQLTKSGNYSIVIVVAIFYLLVLRRPGDEASIPVKLIG